MITLFVYLLIEVSTVQCLNPYYQERQLAVESTTILFDIITDVMSKSIFLVLE